jgi:hypothetical protein
VELRGRPSVILPPALLPASRRSCSRILGSDERIAFIPAACALSGLFAFLQQHLRNLFDAPAALCRHLAKEEIRVAATGTSAFLIQRGTLQTTLVIGSLPFAVMR